MLLLLFFKINLFKKILAETLSECQAVLVHIRTDILLVLVWVQTVCKGYQQTTKVTTGKERGKTNGIFYKKFDTVISQTDSGWSMSILRGHRL